MTFIERGTCSTLVRVWLTFQTTWARFRHTWLLLAGGWLWWIVIADAVVLIHGFMTALEDSNGVDQAYRIYLTVGLLPLLALLLPLLAGQLAVERQASCLLLLFTRPSPRAHLTQRVLALLLPFIVQLVLVVTQLCASTSWAKLSAIAQSWATALALSAISSYWATRARSAPLVVLATLATLVPLGKWLLNDPFPNPYFGPLSVRDRLTETLFQAWNPVVLGGVALLFGIAALGRLGEPEDLL